MQLRIYCLLGLVLLLALHGPQAMAQPQGLSFGVRHRHLFGKCQGLLRMDGDGIAYESDRRQHTRVCSFTDIRWVEIISKTRIALYTYGKPDKFDFQLREGELTGEAYRLLRQNVERGLTSRVLFATMPSSSKLAAKHRHRLGGCDGALRIGSNEILYETENPEDRRLWRIQDIRGFGSTGPYDLRLTTEMETFTFELKEPLRPEVYDDLWQKIHGPRFAPTHRSP